MKPYLLISTLFCLSSCTIVISAGENAPIADSSYGKKDVIAIFSNTTNNTFSNRKTYDNGAEFAWKISYFKSDDKFFVEGVYMNVPSLLVKASITFEWNKFSAGDMTIYAQANENGILFHFGGYVTKISLGSCPKINNIQYTITDSYGPYQKYEQIYSSLCVSWFSLALKEFNNLTTTVDQSLTLW